jgi:hypothetical protein
MPRVYRLPFPLRDALKRFPEKKTENSFAVFEKELFKLLRDLFLVK